MIFVIYKNRNVKEKKYPFKKLIRIFLGRFSPDCIEIFICFYFLLKNLLNFKLIILKNIFNQNDFNLRLKKLLRYDRIFQ